MKKIGISLIFLWILSAIVIVYGIGGQLAPWIWNGSIFIIAPAACIALGIQVIIIIVRGIKHKKLLWNLIFIIATVLLAYPITILFGKSALTYPTHEVSSESVVMEKPIEGGVYFGGKSYKSHAVWPSECYAYDILKKPHNDNSDKLNDYGIYLEDIMAPVTGRVIGMKEDEEDIAPNVEEFKSFLGNYIYIEIEETGTYLILAHLEKDSLQVEVGDKVESGQVIGKVGNSGTTSEPHLHIQHQKENPLKMAVPICAQGLPIVFD